MIGIGGAIPTSSRRFWFPDRSEKDLLDYGIARPIWGDPADRQTGRFLCPDRRSESCVPYPDPGHRPALQGMRLTAPPGAGIAVSGCHARVASGEWRVVSSWRTVASESVREGDYAPRPTPYDRRGPPPMPRAELGIHGLNRRAVNCLEMSKKRGVQAARDSPSPPPTPAGGPGSQAGDEQGGPTWFKGRRGRGNPLCDTEISLHKTHFH